MRSERPEEGGHSGLAAGSGAEGKKAYLYLEPGWGPPVVDFHLFFFSSLFFSHRKMVPRANRWMTCLTFLFRVEVRPRAASPTSSFLHRLAPALSGLLNCVFVL